MQEHLSDDERKRLDKLELLGILDTFPEQAYDDSGFWERVESYIIRHSSAVISHGICPDCYEHLYAGEAPVHPDSPGPSKS